MKTMATSGVWRWRAFLLRMCCLLLCLLVGGLAASSARSIENDDRRLRMTIVEGTPPVPTLSPVVVGATGWETIAYENFEGSFPRSGWVRTGHWGKSNCRPYGGSYSGWCEGNGGLSCFSNYHDNDYSWIIYGPFSLADAIAAKFTFYAWVNSEYGFDFLYWGASTDGENFSVYSTSGTQQQWQARLFDLNGYLGEEQVWICVVWSADYSITYPEGAYVDDILVQKQTAATIRFLGHVYEDGTANPISGATVKVQKQVGQAWEDLAQGPTAADGIFIFTVPGEQGTYRLVEIDPPGYHSTGAVAGSGGQVLDANTILFANIGPGSYDGNIFYDSRATPTSTATATPTSTPTSTATNTPTRTNTPTVTPERRLRAALPVVFKTVNTCPESRNEARFGACGPVMSNVTYYGTMESPTDNWDWYYFDKATTHTVEAWLTDIPVGCDYDLYLYDASNQMVGFSGGIGLVDEHILTQPLPAGRYYLGVFRVPDYGWDAGNPYALRVVYQ